jgi:transcriptional regulator GlxA family with amidase domain
VIFDGFELLDLAGPFEVFQQASRLSGGYSCEVVSREPGLVRSDSGLQVSAGQGVRDCAQSGIDTLVVAGGTGVDAARNDAALVGWIAAAARAARRVTSVCSGVFLLAAAGMVSGRREPVTGAGPRNLPGNTPKPWSTATRSSSTTAPSGRRPA